MKPMDGQFHGNGQSPSLHEKSFHNQFPITKPGLRCYAEPPGSSHEREKIFLGYAGPGGGRVVLEEGVYPLVVVFWGIQSGEKLLIPFNEFLFFHSGFEVQTSIRILTGGITEQPSFGLQAMPETGLR